MDSLYESANSESSNISTCDYIKNEFIQIKLKMKMRYKQSKIECTVFEMFCHKLLEHGTNKPNEHFHCNVDWNSLCDALNVFRCCLIAIWLLFGCMHKCTYGAHAHIIRWFGLYCWYENWYTWWLDSHGIIFEIDWIWFSVVIYIIYKNVRIYVPSVILEYIMDGLQSKKMTKHARINSGHKWDRANMYLMGLHCGLLWYIPFPVYTVQLYIAHSTLHILYLDFISISV